MKTAAYNKTYSKYLRRIIFLVIIGFTGISVNTATPASARTVAAILDEIKRVQSDYKILCGIIDGINENVPKFKSEVTAYRAQYDTAVKEGNRLGRSPEQVSEYNAEVKASQIVLADGTVISDGKSSGLTKLSQLRQANSQVRERMNRLITINLDVIRHNEKVLTEKVSEKSATAHKLRKLRDEFRGSGGNLDILLVKEKKKKVKAPNNVPDGIAVGVPPTAQGDTAVAIVEGEPKTKKPKKNTGSRQPGQNTDVTGSQTRKPKPDPKPENVPGGVEVVAVVDIDLDTDDRNPAPIPGSKAAIEIISGWRIGLLPGNNIGVTNLGTNVNPLITLKQRLNGPVVKGGIEFGPFGGDGLTTGWVGGVKVDYSHLTGTGRQTINDFTPGQLATYINLTGNSGFTFNDNARLRSQTTLDIFKISGELGYQFPLQNDVIVKLYGGVSYRHSQRKTFTTLDTDFRGRTFFNTLNESLILDQFGADLGLDFKFNLAPKVSLTFGGHFGVANTNARFNGSECGDGSTATNGCDGAQYLNNGVGANNNSIDVFGGIKAALTAYVFCRNNPAAVAAALIDVAVAAVKDNCVEVSVIGTYDNYPGQSVVRATAIGGGPIGLTGGREQYGAVMLGAKIMF